MKTFELAIAIEALLLCQPITRDLSGNATDMYQQCYSYHMPERNKTVHRKFLDLEVALDSRFTILSGELLPTTECQKCILVRPIFCTAMSQVSFGTQLAPRSLLNTIGVKQCSRLLPLRLILCIDTVTADLQLLRPWTLLCADHLVLASRHPPLL